LSSTGQTEVKLCQTVKAVVVMSLLMFILAVSGCLVRKDSPAPGCVEYWGLAPMGGCFGKTAILDLAVDPEIDCLTIEVNNCNGGVLEVRNACGEPFVIGGLEIEPSDSAVSLDLLRIENGQYLLTYAEGNFGRYVPPEDEGVEMWGTLGAREIRVSFTKTKELCQ
jgi:hypothetical protein